MEIAQNRKTGKKVFYYEIDGWSIGIRTMDNKPLENLYGGDFHNKYITDYDIEDYQNKNRIYVSEYSKS